MILLSYPTAIIPVISCICVAITALIITYSNNSYTCGDLACTTIEPLVVIKTEHRSANVFIPTWDTILSKSRQSYMGPDIDEQRLLDEISTLQFPTDEGKCKTTAIAGFSFNTLTVGYGIGVYLNVAINALMWSYTHNHTLMISPDGMHGYTSHLCGGFYCLFDEITSCSMPAELSDLAHMKKAVGVIAATKQPFVLLRWTDGTPNIYDSGHELPAKWSHKGIEWYKGVLARYLLRPRQFLVDKYNWYREAQLGRGFYGIHIRRTDKINENKHTPVSQYLQTLDNAMHARNATPMTTHSLPLNVYIATDGPEVLKELQAARKNTRSFTDDRISFKLLDTPRPTGGAVWNTAQANVADLMTELTILVASDVFIGTATSNMGRLVWTLRGSNSSDIFTVDRSFTVFP